MSGTTTPPPNTINVVTPLVVSVVAEVIFLVAIAISWWTKDQSLPYLLGVAATNATTVVNYWLGSSSGSKDKDQTIARKDTPPPGTVTTTVTPQNTTTMGTTR